MACTIENKDTCLGFAGRILKDNKLQLVYLDTSNY